MHLTKSQIKLVNDAKTAGYNIKQDSNCIYLIKGSNRFPKGVVIYQDGTAYRTDVSLSSAITIRTQKQIRSILGI